MHLFAVHLSAPTYLKCVAVLPWMHFSTPAALQYHSLGCSWMSCTSTAGGGGWGGWGGILQFLPHRSVGRVDLRGGGRLPPPTLSPALFFMLFNLSLRYVFQLLNSPKLHSECTLCTDSTVTFCVASSVTPTSVLPLSVCIVVRPRISW